MRGFAASAIDKRIRALQLSGAVQMTGWIPREELYDLYRRAWAFIYPSRFEGLGMPVTEAMATGVPVACSDIEPLRSIARDAALLDSKWFDYLRLRFIHGSTRMAPCWLSMYGTEPTIQPFLQTYVLVDLLTTALLSAELGINFIGLLQSVKLPPLGTSLTYLGCNPSRDPCLPTICCS